MYFKRAIPIKSRIDAVGHVLVQQVRSRASNIAQCPLRGGPSTRERDHPCLTWNHRAIRQRSSSYLQASEGPDHASATVGEISSKMTACIYLWEVIMCVRKGEPVETAALRSWVIIGSVNGCMHPFTDVRHYLVIVELSVIGTSVGVNFRSKSLREIFPPLASVNRAVSPHHAPYTTPLPHPHHSSIPLATLPGFRV
jgi:hypothetical protein